MKESTSGSDFLIRTALAAVWSGLVLGLAVAWRWGWDAGSGFVLALFWGLANFAVLAAILKAATTPGGVRVRPTVGWILVKIVGLYGLGIWLLLHRWFPIPAFLAGFGWPLAVGLLRALGGLTARNRTGETTTS